MSRRRNHKSKSLPKKRNTVTRSMIENPQRNAGAHHTREEDFRKGHSRHRKHKKPQDDPGAFDLPMTRSH